MAAVGEVERLVDEREVRDDVADNGMLEHGPVLPRRVVWVTAADRSVGTGFERDPHRPTPAFDQACAVGAVGGYAHLRTMRSFWQRAKDLLDEMTRFAQLIEANRDARGHIPLAANDFCYGQLRVRLARHVDSKIKCLRARTTGEPSEPKTSGQFDIDCAGAVKPIAQALMLVVDCA